MCDGTPCSCNLLPKNEGGTLPNHRREEQPEYTVTKALLVLAMILSVVYLIVQLLYTYDCPAYQHAVYSRVLGLQIGCRW